MGPEFKTQKKNASIMGNVLPPNNSVVTSKLTAEGQISAFLTDFVKLSRRY